MDLKTYFQISDVKRSHFASDLGVTEVTVSEWATGKKRVAADRCPDIEQLTKGLVRCEDLRPDVNWAYLRGTKKAA